MSHDLSVYGGELDPASLRELVAAAPGLDVQQAGSTADHLIVVRGASRQYSFTIDGPSSIEPEDVPEEVAGKVLGPSTMLQILVEGSAAAEIPHAVRFAKRLAKAMGGAALDEQSGDVLGSARRTAPRPTWDEASFDIDLVEFCWRYLATGITAEQAARAYLRVARRHLPEALPRRFGSYEPLQGKLDELGDDGFVRAVLAENPMVFFANTRPVRGGHIDGGRE